MDRAKVSSLRGSDRRPRHLRPAEDQVIHPLAHIAKIVFIAPWQFRDHAAAVSNVSEGLPYGRPIQSPSPKFGKTIVFELDVLEMDVHDALAQRRRDAWLIRTR